jgi:hypothetical protein
LYVLFALVSEEDRPKVEKYSNCFDIQPKAAWNMFEIGADFEAYSIPKCNLFILL